MKSEADEKLSRRQLTWRANNITYELIAVQPYAMYKHMLLSDAWRRPSQGECIAYGNLVSSDWTMNMVI